MTRQTRTWKRDTFETQNPKMPSEDSKQPTDNLPKQERQALKTLKDDKDIMILPADKGNATVLLNATDYTNKVELILDDGTYRQLKKDPTRKIETDQ